jgi:serine/threonine protein phosphatase PrpC
MRLDERNAVFAVLDGHGGEHGRVASHAAADAMQAHLRANFARLRTEPEQV